MMCFARQLIFSPLRSSFVKHIHKVIPHILPERLFLCDWAKHEFCPKECVENNFHENGHLNMSERQMQFLNVRLRFCLIRYLRRAFDIGTVGRKIKR